MIITYEKNQSNTKTFCLGFLTYAIIS